MRGHIDSIARGINVPTRPTGKGLPCPIFTWVRLAQCIPVRVHIDEEPEGGCARGGYDRHRADRRAACNAGEMKRPVDAALASLTSVYISMDEDFE